MPRTKASSKNLRFPFAERDKAFRDPAFMENRREPVHRWVPWIAGFSSQFVADAFGEYLPARAGAVVLDPFAGVGTTLLQAYLHRFDSVGFEINPYAALVSSTKLAAVQIDEHKLERVIGVIESGQFASDEVHLHKPAAFRSRVPFFSPRIEPQVLQLLAFIETVANRRLAELLRVAFGAVMVKVSNYTYEPSLSSRPGVGKPLLEDADVAAVLAAKLREMHTDIKWLRDRAPKRKPQFRIHCESFLNGHAKLEPGSVDLIVTSPPYMNNYHYVRNTRPQLFWLSLVAETSDLRSLETQNFGKFWQNVRDAEPVPLEFDNKELEEILERLRQTRTEAGAYGGPGWANYVASYFNDCDRFMAATKRVLRRRGVAVIVIGNSIIQGIPIETDRLLGELAKMHRLQLESIVPLRTHRVGASITASSVRRGERTTARLYENAVVLRRP